MELKFSFSFDAATIPGLSIRSSYQVARNPSEGAKKSLGTDISRINGRNGTSSSWMSARVGFILDAYEDEYGGIIINPERLPRNGNEFSRVLGASLSHWKQKVSCLFHTILVILMNQQIIFPILLVT